MFRYKIDVLEALKAKGFNTYRIRTEKLLNESALQSFRTGKIVGIKSLDMLCNLLDCQIGNIIEYIKEEEGEEGK